MDLPLLFSAAHLFVFLSLYEGLGLPALEVMESGVPMVCSNATSLPELVDSAELIYYPHDIDALSVGIV
ncbi:MAG: hypothetical protein ICPDIFCJ_00258 [Sodalis sp. Ppy]|nr:hypothetical protein [Sodalis sp. Ppy]